MHLTGSERKVNLKTFYLLYADVWDATRVSIEEGSMSNAMMRATLHFSLLSPSYCRSYDKRYCECMVQEIRPSSGLVVITLQTEGVGIRGGSRDSILLLVAPSMTGNHVEAETFANFARTLPMNMTYAHTILALRACCQQGIT